MNVLAVDVGGSHVKALRSDESEPRKVGSGPWLTPDDLVDAVGRLGGGRSWDRLSLGIPAVVEDDVIVREPRHLGTGWVGFDFRRAFECPVRVMNDAAMQALGSWRDGTMLFLGLGTGLGSAMVVDGRVLPMELAHLPYRKHRTLEMYLGEAGRHRRGGRKWRKHVWRVVGMLRAALLPDEVVIGGGNVRRLHDPPPGVRFGANRYAFRGGFRLWHSPDTWSTP